MQPDPLTRPKVESMVFSDLTYFCDSIVRATQMLNPQILPTSDLIRPEIFKPCPYLFADAALAPWLAVGQIAHVTMQTEGIPVCTHELFTFQLQHSA